MPAATRKNKRAAAEEQDDVAAPPPRRRRRWLFSTTILLGLPAVVWFAPVVASWGPILNRIVRGASADFHGAVSIGSASLGWMSPVVLRDIHVSDEQGKEIASVPLVASGKSLFALLMSPHDLGEFKVDRPQVALVIRDRGSNVEDAVGELVREAAEKRPQRLTGVVLSISEGVANIDDAASGRQWQIDELSCEITVPSDFAQALAVTASGRVNPGQSPGRFSFHLKAQPGVPSAENAEETAPPLATGQGEFALTSQALPLELIEPVARRLSAGTELAGVLDATINGHWNFTTAGAPRGEITGQVTATHLMLVGPLAGDDRLRLNSISIPCDIVRDGGRLEIRRCELQTDVGQLTCTGTIEQLDKLDPSVVKSIWNVLPHAEGEIKGTLDLAKLSQVLPATLRVREGMTIEEGAVNLDLTCGGAAGVWSANGRIETTRLLATEQGRQITWDHPLLVTVSGHDTPQGPVIEALNGQSDFLKFEGSGTPEFFGLTANFELQRLTEELQQFLDLGELRVAGDGFGRLNWKRAPDDTFALDAQLQATNFFLSRPGRPAWSDPQLLVTAAARGQLAGRDVKVVESAMLQVAAATDEFTLNLLSPVSEPTEQTPWPIDAHLQGDLARWMARVEPWSKGGGHGWEIGGQADVVTTVRYTNDVVEVQKCQADFGELHVWGPNLFLDEQRLRVIGNGQLNVPAGLLTLKDITLTATDMAGRVQDAQLALAPDKGATRVGHAELQGNLATFSRWVQDPRQPATMQVSGLLAASLRADLNERSPALDLTVTVEDLAAVPRSGQAWRERQLRLTASSMYDEASDTLQLARVELDGELAKLTAAGRIERWKKDRAITLAGKTDYDLEKISVLLQPYFNGHVRATGRESREFSLAGLLRPAPADERAAPQPNGWAEQMTGKASFGWQTASLAGFEVAPGELQLLLGEGVLQLAPARLSVSGGTVSLAPVVRLFPAPAELTMPAGPVAERVRVTPEMCEDWLKYALPPVFKSPRVEGAFSATVGSCRVPLDNPQAADAAAQIIIHSLDVEPGPLIQELAVVLGQPTAARLAQDSRIDIRVVQGRVYHRGLELRFPELTIRTYGSVGFDETLAIMTEMNMPATWMREGALSNALKNQVIQIPIAGTLSKPEIDRKVLGDLRQQFVKDLGNAAGNVLIDQLQKQLDRLLAPPPPR